MITLLLALVPVALPQLPDDEPAGFAGGELVVDRTLFVLNDEVLTASKLQRRIDMLQRRFPEAPESDLASAALQAEIRRMLGREGFRRMGLDESQVERLVRLRIEDLQREDGSLARFEARLAAEGFTLETMREAIREEFMYNAWVDILAGQAPSPTEGLRQLPDPTAEEIRAAYAATPDQWQQAEVVEWVTLSYFDGGEKAALETAQNLRAGLARGEATLSEARAQASSVTPGSGDPGAQALRRELVDFLSTAAPGDASPVHVIRGLGGQFSVMTERKEPREISFEEAQALVRRDLVREREVQAELREMVRLLDSSFVWHAPEVGRFLAQLRAETTAQNAEEL